MWWKERHKRRRVPGRSSALSTDSLGKGLRKELGNESGKELGKEPGKELVILSKRLLENSSALELKFALQTRKRNDVLPTPSLRKQGLAQRRARAQEELPREIRAAPERRHKTRLDAELVLGGAGSVSPEPQIKGSGSRCDCRGAGHALRFPSRAAGVVYL